ncbi:MAG: zinc dependent phospholipase C family protein [Thermodesulfobacteriota bacterium]
MAWGPGVHLALGNHLLGNLHLLAGPVAAVIQAYQESFLYGCLSADILVGKGKKLTRTHCHGWQAGLKLLDSVPEDNLKAYAYGYLSHLAADVVAHNYYVPNMLQLGKGKGKISHVYIEMQADRNICHNKADLKKILAKPQKKADSLLIDILNKPRFIFSFKKRLFRSGLALSRKQACSCYLDFMAEKTASDSDYFEYQDEMTKLSFYLIIDCLQNTENSVVSEFDPMGFENLGAVKKSKSPSTQKMSQVKPFFLPALNLLALDTSG